MNKSIKGQWTSILGRYVAASATKGKDIIVTGDWQGYNSVDETKIFNHYGYWKDGPRVPVKLYQHCQVTIGNQAVVAGGLEKTLN